MSSMKYGRLSDCPHLKLATLSLRSYLPPLKVIRDPRRAAHWVSDDEKEHFPVMRRVNGNFYHILDFNSHSNNKNAAMKVIRGSQFSLSFEW
jgi:hypothetical protein